MNKKLSTLVVVAAMAMGFAGCAAAPNEQETENAVQTEVEDINNKIVVNHAFGQTVLDEVPTRVTAIGWENQDTPLALGIVPVGSSKANYGSTGKLGLHPWTEEAYEKLNGKDMVVFDDTDGLDYEAIADTHPDVILASYSGMTKDEYERLSQIAPVIAYPEGPWQTLWRDQTIMNAAALGQKEAGEKLVKDTEKLIEDKVAEHPELKDKNAAFFWVSPDDLSSFFVYTPKDPRAAYLTDLGLELPESVQKLADESDEFSISISRENADQFKDVDIMVVYGNENLLKAMQKDPVFSQIPAVKNGAVVLIDETSDLAGGATPSILSIPYNIDTYLDLLSQAAKKVQ